MLKVVNSLVNFFLNPFFRKLDITYRILTKSQCLPTHILPSTLKTIFILSNVRNNQKNGLNVLRINKYRLIHNFWVLVNSETKAQHVYNVKNITNSKTTNFYFTMQGIIKSNKNILQLYYFFDKIVFSKGSYLYWVDNILYHYQNIIKDQSKVYNVRIYLFFMYLNVCTTFNKNISFIKVNLTQFRGVENFFKVLSQVKISTVTTSSQKTNIKLKKTNTYTNNHRNTLKAYYNFYKDELISSTNLVMSYILINNTNFIKKTTQISNLDLAEKFKTLTLTWYNKVHNTTHDVSKHVVVMYLRAARHFNKGRYSRNRQLYRTGVYWCIWLNVVIVYALHYYFYRVVFAFGYLWLPLSVMILSIFSSRVYKYRYYNLNQLIQEFKEYNNFIFYILLKFNIYCSNFLRNIQVNLKRFYTSFKSVALISLENFVFIVRSLFK